MPITSEQARQLLATNPSALRGANLTNADLSHLDLRGADLSFATLAGVKLNGALFDDQTRFDNCNVEGASFLDTIPHTKSGAVKGDKRAAVTRDFLTLAKCANIDKATFARPNPIKALAAKNMKMTPEEYAQAEKVKDSAERRDFANMREKGGKLYDQL